jgi:glutamyl-tRNA(Gln) amidotransferase subunit E
MLMGIAMKSLRGKVSGEKISRSLESKISKILENKA